MSNDNIIELDNTHSQRRKFDHIPDRGDDWVVDGVRLIPDWGDSELFVGRALLCIAHNGTLYWVEMDGRGGLTIPSGKSGIYYDVSNESVVVGSAPSEPTLKIGSVDAGSKTTDESVNRDPTYDVVNAEEQNSTVHWATEDKYPRWEDVQTLFDNVSKGDVVMLENRTYPFDFAGNDHEAVSLTTNQVTVMGAGYGSIIFLESDTTETNEGADIFETNSKGVTLANFHIHGNWQNNSAGEENITGTEDGHNLTVTNDYGHIHNIWSRNSTGDGIELASNATGNLVSNCHFHSNWEHGVGLNTSQDNLILGCDIEREEHGALIGLYNGNGNHRNRVIGCRLKDGNSWGVKVIGVDGKITDFTFAFNRVEDITGGNAMVISDGPNNIITERTTVANNRFVNVTDDAISIGGARNTVIENNRFKDIDKRAVVASGFTEEGITIRDNEFADVNQGSSANDDCILIGNDSDVWNIHVEGNSVIRTPDSVDTARNFLNIKSSSGGYHDTYVRNNAPIDVKNNWINDGGFSGNVEIVRNGAEILENSVTTTASGDGSTATFSLSHGCSRVPTSFQVTPLTADAAGDWYKSGENASAIDITYLSAPASGTDNLKWKVDARVDHNGM